MQGDGDRSVHARFYEAAAAGVVMQAEILPVSRNIGALAAYLPNMKRARDFIERTRDPRNNLFLVGPACNLLAPSHGASSCRRALSERATWRAFPSPTSRSLDRMVELCKLAGDQETLLEYERRISRA